MVWERFWQTVPKPFPNHSQTIKLAVLENPKLSAVKLAQKIKEYMRDQPWYPKETCLRKFLKSNNFVKRRPSLKPPLTIANRLKRLAFAKKNG